jgi:hypothetical protein
MNNQNTNLETRTNKKCPFELATNNKLLCPSNKYCEYKGDPAAYKNEKVYYECLSLVKKYCSGNEENQEEVKWQKEKQIRA